MQRVPVAVLVGHPERTTAADVHPARRPESSLLTFNRLAEYLIWAVLQPPAVDVKTIIVRCSGAMI
jgi:hypothetical protein